MHTYRDAIRSADGSSPVAFAGILYPGGDLRFGEQIAAISAIPGQTATLKESLRAVIVSALRAHRAMLEGL
jgi:hypothetical protein